jgi:hypothetical protein
MYEGAIALLVGVLDSDRLRNPSYSAATAHDVAKWIDRSVECEPGCEPSLDIESVPRIRGSSSKYCQVAAERMWGARLRKYWRQREALVSAALLLLHGEQLQVAATPISGKLRKMQKMMRNINSEKD